MLILKIKPKYVLHICQWDTYIALNKKKTNLEHYIMPSQRNIILKGAKSYLMQLRSSLSILNIYPMTKKDYSQIEILLKFIEFNFSPF